MQLKKAIKSTIGNMMERNGFTLRDSVAGYYEFVLNDDSLRVVVDRNPRPPAELRVCFYYRDYRGGFSSFELNQLADYKDLDLFYTSQEELLEKLKIICDCIEPHAISLLMNIRDHHVYFSEEMRILLSVNPEKQAINYAKSNLLKVSYDLANFLFVENQITLMRGDIISNWRSIFAEYIDEITNIISYYGEIVRKKNPSEAKWNWGPHNSYGLEYDQGFRYPQADVIIYWNYGLYMPAFRLVPIDLR